MEAFSERMSLPGGLASIELRAGDESEPEHKEAGVKTEAMIKSDWAKVQAVSLGTPTTVVLYKDQAPPGNRTEWVGGRVSPCRRARGLRKNRSGGPNLLRQRGCPGHGHCRDSAGVRGLRNADQDRRRVGPAGVP